jgi:hypothetical protein
MQVDQKDKEIEQTGQVVVEESNAYSLFMYAVRSQSQEIIILGV